MVFSILKRKEIISFMYKEKSLHFPHWSVYLSHLYFQVRKYDNVYNTLNIFTKNTSHIWFSKNMKFQRE